MATDKEPCRAAGSVQLKIVQVPAQGGALSDPAPAPPKVMAPGPGLHPPSSTASPSVMVIAKLAPGGASASGQPHVTQPAVSQVASINQGPGPGRTVVITVPRAAPPQTATVPPRLPQTTSTQLPANIHIPPGMMLIRSDSGQLMLISQQALAQAQQGSRGVIGQASRILTPQVSTPAGNKTNEKVTVIKMASPSTFQPAPVQKTTMVIGVAPKAAVIPNLSTVSARANQPPVQAVVTETKKEPPATFSHETLESVKKCKNFLVTLIKLASSDSRSANMAHNVRGLVRSLLEGKLEAEAFTDQLYRELKSTPQPCLAPFLKKSLPAVRLLTADPQLFIQQAAASTSKPNTSASSMKQPATDPGHTLRASKQVIRQPGGLTLRPALTTLAQSRNCTSKSSRPHLRHTMVQSGKQFTESFAMKQPFAQDPTRHTKFLFKDTSGSYKEDDDINDVASMAGVNLTEESARILTTVVGSVEQSCQDQPFLSASPVLSRALHAGEALGITDVSPEVVALVSHATQEYLRKLMEKLTVVAEHRKLALKEDLWHVKVSDVRSQLHFLEEVESLKKKRKDEEERERLLRLARSRSHNEDPQHQQLKQRAKVLQQMEEAQLQHREANLTALAAIGPRRKRPLVHTESQIALLPRQAVQRVSRVVLRDLLVCMEEDHFLRHSLTLYKAML